MKADHILMIGFGGPEKEEDVKPFILEVARGRNIPQARLDEVAGHYKKIGGYSPYNAHAREIVKGLSASLIEEKVNLPVFLGMKNWSPTLSEVLNSVARMGHRKGVVILLAPHRSPASCRRYRDALEEEVIRQQLPLEYVFCEPWHNHSEFITANAELLREALMSLPEEERSNAHVIFTAHSIPERMSTSCSSCSYADEFLETSRLIASSLDMDDWSFAYQSRSGRPEDPWLGPSLEDVIVDKCLPKRKTAVVVPVGFLIDNAEVLYDLGVEALGGAQKIGLRLVLVPTAGSRAEVISMLKSLALSAAELATSDKHFFQNFPSSCKTMIQNKLSE